VSRNRAEEDADESGRSARLVPKRRGRVLVVDDEPALAAALARVLSLEHDVVTETSAQRALALLVGGERFDLVLCDLMMPEMTGMDLYDEVSRVAPGLAETLVFMTGGAFTSRAREFLDQVPNARLEKPIDFGALRALIHGMLESR
jgi:CheY-like chemotaxis protein